MRAAARTLCSPETQLLCATLQGTCAQLGLLLQQPSPIQGPQQAWLPGHVAAATSLASLLQLPHGSSSTQRPKQQPPLSTRRPWLQQQTCSASFLQTRQAHTSAAADSTKSRAARPKLGRTHPPLFSKPSSSSSSSRSSRSTAPAAAAERSDDEDEWEQGEAAAAPTDLLHPQTWYPAARAMAPRSLVAHLGPTNSGKTHAALAALAAAPSGVFCGPLRLLACEVRCRRKTVGTKHAHAHKHLYQSRCKKALDGQCIMHHAPCS
jgi:hypothetical protein